jgi:hypothetical protein
MENNIALHSTSCLWLGYYVASVLRIPPYGVWGIELLCGVLGIQALIST